MPGDENIRRMRRTVSFSRPLYAVMSGSKPLAGVRPMLVDQRCEPATDCIEAMSMNKAIAYVFVDVIRFYHLDLRVNVVFRAIINQFLGLSGASYNRSIVINPIPVECKIVDGHLSSGRHTYLGITPVWFHQRRVSSNVIIHRDRRDHVVQRFVIWLEFVCRIYKDSPLRTEGKHVFHFTCGGRKGIDRCTFRLC